MPFAHDYSSLEWSLRDSNNICHVLIRQGPYLTWKWVGEPDYTHRWTGDSCPHGRACQEALQSESPVLVEDLVPPAVTLLLVFLPQVAVDLNWWKSRRIPRMEVRCTVSFTSKDHPFILVKGK